MQSTMSVLKVHCHICSRLIIIVNDACTDYLQAQQTFIFPHSSVPHTSGDHPVVTQQLLSKTGSIYPLCATFPNAKIVVLRNNKAYHPKTFRIFRSVDDRIYRASGIQVYLETYPVTYANVTWIVLRMFTSGEHNVNSESLEATARELNGGYTCRAEGALWQNPQNITIHLNFTTQLVGK